MKEADVCLGQFGITEHTQLVVPAKVYDAIAMAKPVITGDTKAVKAVFTDQENIILCPVANPEALADKILLLKKNPALKEKISQNGYRVFQEKFTPAKTGANLAVIIQKMVKDR